MAQKVTVISQRLLSTQLRHTGFSKLEIISCVFLPLKGVLKRAAGNNFVNLLIPFIEVRGYYAK